MPTGIPVTPLPPGHGDEVDLAEQFGVAGIRGRGVGGGEHQPVGVTGKGGVFLALLDEADTDQHRGAGGRGLRPRSLPGPLRWAAFLER